MPEEAFRDIVAALPSSVCVVYCAALNICVGDQISLFDTGQNEIKSLKIISTMLPFGVLVDLRLATTV